MNHNEHKHDKHQKERILVALKKANSLSARMIQMVEADTYCVDVMQQNAAVMGLHKSVHHMLMEDHLHACFSDAMASDDDARKADMIEEILKVSKLANK